MRFWHLVAWRAVATRRRRVESACAQAQHYGNVIGHIHADSHIRRMRSCSAKPSLGPLPILRLHRGVALAVIMLH